MEKNFIRVRSVKDIVLFILFIIIGCVLVVIPVGASVSFGGGVMLIVLGVILAFILKTAYKDEETGEMFIKKELSFQQHLYTTISSAIMENPETISMADEGKGNAVKLDIYYNRALNKAYLQLFKYVPYHYEPCTQLYEYELSRIKNLIE